ncbi:MAG: succinate dehydrogenase iron-sulfur subunit [Calditrichaeota bacterium]|nr:succinate dehydrogenase iron-sulfur subunit [Calditrichota bacterium]
MHITFKVRRFDPNKEASQAFYQEFPVKTQPGMTILDALIDIKARQDGALTFRKSCRSAICGSCAMQIHGLNRLACETQVEPLKKTTLVIDPLPGFRIIKDLAVDMESFYEHLARVKPYLINEEPPPARERLQSEAEFKLIEDPIACILCASCTSSCPSFWYDTEYVGPSALTKAYRYNFDSRDHGAGERMEVLDNKHGLWRCHTIFNCMDACPKKIKITQHISNLKKMVVAERY